MAKTAFLEDVCDILDSQRVPVTAKDRTKGIYPYYGANGIQDYVDDYIFDDELVLLAEDGGNFGSKDRPIAYRVSGKCWVNNHAHVLKAKDCIDVDYLCYSIMFYDVSSMVNGATRQKLNQATMRKMLIPLPSKEKQLEIVANLDKVTCTIDLCNTILEKLDLLVKSRFVEMFGDTEVNSNNHPVHKLSDLCTVSSSKRIYQEEQSSSGVPFLRISNLVELIDNGRFGSDLFIPEEKYNELFTNGLVPKADDILVTSRGTLGKCYIIQEHDKFYFQDGMISWLYDIDKSITPLYLTLLFDTRDIKRQIDNLQSGSTVAYLSIAMLKKLNIVVPPLALQEQFAAFVEQTDKSKLAVKQVLEKAETLKKALMQEYFG